MQSTNRVFDDLAALLTNAAGAAKGARDEVALLLRAQGERIAGELALASREEVEVAKDLARKALAKLDAVGERLGEIEARLTRLESMNAARSARPESDLSHPE